MLEVPIKMPQLSPLLICLHLLFIICNIQPSSGQCSATYFQIFGNIAPPQNAIIAAAKQNNQAAVACLLASDGANIDTSDPQTGMTPLIIAAKMNFFPLLQFLTSKGASSHEKDITGNTALIWAVTMGNDNCATYLISNTRVPTDAQNLNGDSALMVAARQNRIAVVTALIARRARMNLINNAGETALIIACEKANNDIALAMINATPMPNLDIQSKNYGLTAVMAAAKTGSGSVVSALISKGANLNLHGEHGYAALDWANQNGYSQIVLQLITYGAKYKLRGAQISSS
jgi:serine/threonine-protein phosphatase 6 regulatory ankyrin repeat subunit B